jgi:methyl-accepting chemotaxis protein
MEEVVVSVRRVTDIMAEITNAGEEQRAGIEQVNSAIAGMDAVTQQNAALVEEATAASHSMQEQAAALAALVAVFQLDGERERARVRLVPGQAQTPALARLPDARPVRRRA